MLRAAAVETRGTVEEGLATASATETPISAEARRARPGSVVKEAGMDPVEVAGSGGGGPAGRKWEAEVPPSLAGRLTGVGGGGPAGREGAADPPEPLAGSGSESGEGGDEVSLDDSSTAGAALAFALALPRPRLLPTSATRLFAIAQRSLQGSGIGRRSPYAEPNVLEVSRWNAAELAQGLSCGRESKQVMRKQSQKDLGTPDEETSSRGRCNGAVLLDLASQLPLKQLREMSSLFESMDKDGNGMLDQAELAEGLRLGGLAPAAAADTAERLAKGAGGRVEFSRFVAALAPSCEELIDDEHLRSSFNRLDANGDGYVSRCELQRLLERGSKASSTPEDKVDVNRREKAARSAQKAFDAISGEGRQRVSFESFRRHLGSFVA
ncbi:Calml3 [Symbiodinium sp. CCMP2592]|nr:Calml3 [Symbiodinium sp. CCMP2592]